MWPRQVIVLEVLSKYSTQVFFRKHDDVVEPFSSDAADQALSKGIAAKVIAVR